MKRRNRRKKNKNIYKKNFFERNRKKKRKRKNVSSLPTDRSVSPPRKKLRMDLTNDRRNDRSNNNLNHNINQPPPQRCENSVILLQREVTSKVSFYFLEQLLVKHGLHSQLQFFVTETKKSLRIELSNQGHAQRLIQFIKHFLPCRILSSPGPLVTNLSMLPFQPYDLAILSPNQFQKSGKTCGPFLVCCDYGPTVRFVDPQTLRTCDVDGKSGTKLRRLFSISQAQEYTVMNIRYSGLRTENNTFVHGEVEIEKTNEIGTGVSKIVPCHFAHYLEVGDVVYGFDLESMNWGDRVDRFKEDGKTGSIGNFNIQVILVRKKFRHRVVKHWKLMNLGTNIVRMDRGEDYQEFTNLVAENESLRKNIKLFKNENYDFSNWGKEEKQKGLDVVQLTELLEDLKIDD